MRILFVHRTFPAQFRCLATALGMDTRHRVCFLTTIQEQEIPGVRKLLYCVKREAAQETHAYVRYAENALYYGMAAYEAAWKLKREGWIPDVIVGHSGWGPLQFLKELFPTTPLIGYFEWFYRAQGSSHGFDPAQSVTADMAAGIRTKNVPILHELYTADAGITPTYWQQAQFPIEFQAKIRVLHDGMDTNFFQPKEGTKLVLPRQRLDLSGAEEIVTYVTRAMEPMRGFPQFMEAVAEIQRRRPKCHVVIVGNDRTEYGKPREDGKTYRQWALENFTYDPTRLHFTGPLFLEEYRTVLQASSAHIYLTYPYILSWSFLEAMACGCMMISSRTAPVQEVMADGENGLLVDFFAPMQIADRVDQVFAEPEATRRMREQARQTVLEKYSFQTLYPQHLAFLQEVAGKR
ncbi:MAG: glycosyltransferase [Negativicutes bacterium]|nr:glycosyltransferase [Negativicutes bacterium]